MAGNELGVGGRLGETPLPHQPGCFVVAYRAAHWTSDQHVLFPKSLILPSIAEVFANRTAANVPIGVWSAVAMPCHDVVVAMDTTPSPAVIERPEPQPFLDIYLKQYASPLSLTTLLIEGVPKMRCHK